MYGGQKRAWGPLELHQALFELSNLGAQVLCHTQGS